MLKLSASSVGTYEKCPRKYFYQYIEKPEIPKVEWPHLEFGTVSHRVLELFHEHLINNVLDVTKWPDLMRDCFKKAIKESEDRLTFHLIKDDLPYLRKIIQDYLNKIRLEGLPPVLHNELDFNFKIQDITVRGFIDRVDRWDKESFHIVDYKTSKSGDYLDSFQLCLYALAIKEKYPETKYVTGSYVLLKLNSTLKSWDFTEKTYKETIDKVIRLGKDINTETLWSPKPSALCNFCDFKSICQDSWTGNDDVNWGK